MDRIGLIGVGNVGTGFARRLLEQGYPLIVHDLKPERTAAAAAQGAKEGSSPAEVAANADLVMLSLPGSHAVEQVMEGEEGLLAHLRPGQVVIDTGTSHPDTDVRYERLCRERGAALVDAPITGRSPGWIIMAGGGEADYERVRPLLEVLAYKVGHVGAVGRGQVLKLANQAVLAGQLAVFAEAVCFLQQEGMDARLLKDFLELPIGDALYGDDFHAGGHLALHYKDLGYVLDVAHRSGAQVPLTGLVHEVFKATARYGDPDWGQPGIVTWWRRLNGGGD